MPASILQSGGIVTQGWHNPSSAMMMLMCRKGTIQVSLAFRTSSQVTWSVSCCNSSSASQHCGPPCKASVTYCTYTSRVRLPCVAGNYAVCPGLAGRTRKREELPAKKENSPRSFHRPK
ncbi:MAG: hypothetical protein MZV63_58190 [Marinilabiliales bacterium]|nr:hypothetical protein [Marinilabiliales bacterium]